jgi:hypothetical protein
MTDDRGIRGRRVLGRRRLCTTIAVAIGALVCVCASIAAASTGGTGLGGTPRTPQTTPVKTASGNPFAVRGMWIWYVSMSDHGNLSAIVARAHRYGIKTLMIKSGDGTGTWSQFTPKLVSKLHASGLKVCGWQYVYGNAPATEAHVGAAAVRAGADCLLIDAEGEYEGKYVQAQRYMTTLRKLVGAHFPLALAGFPYVDYHPAYPYSVFLGRGGAQYNTPQMYWVDIGTTVDTVYSHTYDINRIYQRPIYPLGQVYNSPPNSDIVRFRQLSLAYGSGGGISWWDWQEAGNKWHYVGAPIGTPANFTPDTSYTRVGRGDQGDVVVWAEEHLISAGQRVAVDGSFGPKVQSAVKRFQTAHGLRATGVIDTTTWQLLLHYAPATIHWTKHSARIATAAGVGNLTPVPESAGLRAKRNELAGAPGRGSLPGRPR